MFAEIQKSSFSLNSRRFLELCVLLMMAAMLSGECAAKESIIDGIDEQPEEEQLSEEERWLLDEEDLDDIEDGDIVISDPLEPVNRVFFQFNDKLYFWLLKPMARGYAFVIPEDLRVSVRNFFTNLEFPVRGVNTLLQAKWKASSIELARFLINSTLGVAGLFDPAKLNFSLDAPSEEDSGQTLGVYGVGDSIYLYWPFFGPSNIRDSFGRGGDYFLKPLTYLTWSDTDAVYGFFAGETVNNTSLKIGDYEQLKEISIDPYVALRDAYLQNRQSKIKE